MVRRQRGQSTLEYVLMSVWLVLLLYMFHVPQTVVDAIERRVEKTEAIQGLPVP